jgi:hypothetical protein
VLRSQVLTPAFSHHVYDYTAAVDTDVTSVRVIPAVMVGTDA